MSGEMVKNKYIFPDFVANVMAKMDVRTQFEASMMSMTFIMIGMVLSLVYAMIYMDLRMWFKVVLIINGVSGVVFMFSYLVTTFQQYQNYMAAKEMSMILTTEKEVNYNA